VRPYLIPLMKKRTRIVLLAAIAVSAGTILYHLFWGKLFAFAPFPPGFSKREAAGAEVYVQRGAAFDQPAVLEACLADVEKTHGLSFLRKPKIFFFRRDRDYLRRTVTRARFFAYPNGVVVCSPWGMREAAEGRISLEIYLKHELSHVLLFQHMGIVRASFSFPKWLLEGVAVLRSGQMGTSWYPDRAETLRQIGRGNFLPPADFGKKRGDRVRLDVPNRSAFVYSEFACLVGRMIDVYGEAKFGEYLGWMMAGGRPGDVFREVFGAEFDAFIKDFRARLAEKAGSSGYLRTGE